MKAVDVLVFDLLPAHNIGQVLSTSPFPTLAVMPQVKIGGVDAFVQYAGQAPGAVAGLYQVNAVVPAGVTTGTAVEIVIAAGSFESPGGVTGGRPGAGLRGPSGPRGPGMGPRGPLIVVVSVIMQHAPGVQVRNPTRRPRRPWEEGPPAGIRRAPETAEEPHRRTCRPDSFAARPLSMCR